MADEAERFFGSSSKMIDKLQSYNFSITHRKASESKVAEGVVTSGSAWSRVNGCGSHIVELHSNHFRWAKYLSLIYRIKESQEAF